MDKTITVEGHFKPVTLTKPEYVRRWTNTVSEIINLVQTRHEAEVVAEITAKAAWLAGNEFDRIYNKQVDAKGREELQNQMEYGPHEE